MVIFLFLDRVFTLIVLFVVKMVFAWDKFLNYIKMLHHRIFGGEGWAKICHFFALTDMLLYFPNNTSRVICLGNKH